MIDDRTIELPIGEQLQALMRRAYERSGTNQGHDPYNHFGRLAHDATSAFLKRQAS